MESQEEKIRRIYLNKWRKEMIEEFPEWFSFINNELDGIKWEVNPFGFVVSNTNVFEIQQIAELELPIGGIIQKFVAMAIESHPDYAVNVCFDIEKAEVESHE